MQYVEGGDLGLKSSAESQLSGLNKFFVRNFLVN